MGRDTGSKDSQLTVLFSSLQEGQNIQGEVKLIIHPIILLQMGRDISKGGDQTRDVMVLRLQTVPDIDKEGTLPNVLRLRPPEEGIIDQEAPRLVDSKAQVAGDTTGRPVAESGENYQHLGTLHSNSIVFAVVTTIQA